MAKLTTKQIFKALKAENLGLKMARVKKPKHNKLRYIAGRKLQKHSPLKDGEIYAVTEPEYLGKITQRRDIDVLPLHESPRGMPGVI